MDPRSFDDQLRAAREGEPSACRWLWDRYAGQITGFLLARGTPEVDEVVNDVFLAAFTGLGHFEGAEPDLRGWLFQIARNKRVDAIRALARRPAPSALEESASVVHADADAALVAVIEDLDLRGVLETLTPDQRDVVVLRFVADLSLEQTAVAVSKPTGAVKALQHRALAQLRKKFADDPYPATTSETMS